MPSCKLFNKKILKLLDKSYNQIIYVKSNNRINMKKFANDLIKTVELPYDSDEYKRIFYSLNLNLCLPSAEINIKSLASIPINFSVNNKNENENALTLESWVNQDGFREENSIESVINDGSFHINQDNPMKFLIGKLTENNKMLEENMEYTFILWKINRK